MAVLAFTLKFIHFLLEARLLPWKRLELVLRQGRGSAPELEPLISIEATEGEACFAIFFVPR